MERLCFALRSKSKSDKPNALRLADVLQSGADDPMWAHHCEMSKGTCDAAAAELRRLHDENEMLKAEIAEQARVNGMGGEREARLMALNAELVEALRRLIDMDVAYRRGPVVEEAVEKARAALAKVEANK